MFKAFGWELAKLNNQEARHPVFDYINGWISLKFGYLGSSGTIECFFSHSIFDMFQSIFSFFKFHFPNFLNQCMFLLYPVFFHLALKYEICIHGLSWSRSVWFQKRDFPKVLRFSCGKKLHSQQGHHNHIIFIFHNVIGRKG